MFTAAGIVGVESEGRTITGVPGWRFVVTGQQNDRTGGKSIWSELLRMNRERRTAIIRSRAMATNPPPTVEDSQVLLRLEDYIELLVYKYEHERKGCS